MTGPAPKIVMDNIAIERSMIRGWVTSHIESIECLVVFIGRGAEGPVPMVGCGKLRCLLQTATCSLSFLLVAMTSKFV